MPTIAPVIPRIGEQIRLSLILAKSAADSQVFISQSCPASATLVDDLYSSLPSNPTTALNPHLPTPAMSNWDQSEMLVLSIALQSQINLPVPYSGLISTIEKV